MSENVIPFGGITRLDLPTDTILEQAKGHVTNGGIMVLGYDAAGGLYFASSMADGGEVLWLLEQAKKELLKDGE